MTLGMKRALAMGGLFIAAPTMLAGAAAAVIAPNGAPGVALLLFGAGCAGAAIEFLCESGQGQRVSDREWREFRADMDRRAREQEWSA